MTQNPNSSVIRTDSAGYVEMIRNTIDAPSVAKAFSDDLDSDPRFDDPSDMYAERYRLIMQGLWIGKRRSSLLVETACMLAACILTIISADDYWDIFPDGIDTNDLLKSVSASLSTIAAFEDKELNTWWKCLVTVAENHMIEDYRLDQASAGTVLGMRSITSLLASRLSVISEEMQSISKS